MLPPSFDVLEQRLRGRSKDSEEAIAAAAGHVARDEVDAVAEYDYVVVNDELDRCVDGSERSSRPSARGWRAGGRRRDDRDDVQSKDRDATASDELVSTESTAADARARTRSSS